VRQTTFLRMLCIAAAGLALGGCGDGGEPVAGEPEPDPPAPDPPGVVKAVSISPAGFPDDFSGTLEFFAEAASFTDPGVLWNGAWRDDVFQGGNAGTPPGAALLTVTQGADRGFQPLLVFGWRSGEELFIRVPENAVNDWRNDDAVRLLGDAVAGLAEAHEPPFVFLGNESDFYFAQDPEDYARWVAAYEAVYDRIKAVSPDTRVGPVFQYEHMAGLGALAGHTTPRWGALESHDLARVDVVGLTVYPFFAHATPAAIPEAYLEPLTTRIGSTPVVITETGWPAEAPEGFEPPWQVGPGLQVSFLDALARILDGRAVDGVTWLYLHPPVEPSNGQLSPLEWQIFHSLSLRDAAGTKRPVYDEWEAFRP
jgi:hypothetical protein